MAILARNTPQQRAAQRMAPTPRNPWALTTSGMAVDLVAPKPEMILWADVAEGLSKLARFNGHTPGRFYSVAQHCVIGADYAVDNCGPGVALAFLLHDAHEYTIGDDITPKVRALIAHANRAFTGRPGYSAGEVVKEAFVALKYALDSAIYPAAGVAWPLPLDVRMAVKDLDARMLITERMRFLPQNRHHWGEEVEAHKPLPIRGRFTPLSMGDAQIEWLKRLKRLAPGIII